ncbi:putative glutamate--cysteine ligase [Fischerella thermalis CCMEE 5273]|uniref:Putative glutamate--cysteine ligase n=1 Tax=Chlorogloeopsis fritschii PCC 6912 TaxID=211165 RepID=A0A3S1A1W1_CHLFR|nr:glutamate--cysteine ligase [Chlorogloeopsis fritschii]PMB06399.1 putative glutamate--cysteine ligase [Fischerella thermalis CCMEE 5273]PMB49965.1 putative glutamate--cysteine ligase [Fischerella thermalis CCMEE 5205]RUR83672.1 putative glutamate--cysteine ligase [Chlorogloeopsis fritschii PCC 6912]
MLLLKGFEVEIYTGTTQGDIVGVSDKIVAALDGFTQEPDSRNVEYITAPLYKYKQLLFELVRPRLELRKYLKRIGNYTLVPGSTLSLGNSESFYRSDPSNSYHTYIEQTYGTNVVTTSIHINIGISDPELLMRAYRLIRVEAPLYLALSASSPFLDGCVTGYHSTRWKIFPKTPNNVPLFESHAHYIKWTEDQLADGTMQNVRHLWISVRPNGNCRPYNLNRLELRICDLIVDPIALLAVTALLEARLWQLIDDPSLDPLERSIFSTATRSEDLLAITSANEATVSCQSLDAELRHWQDGRKIFARNWIEEIYQEVWLIAKKKGFSFFLSPIQKILREGNEAQRWLKMHKQGLDSRSIVIQAIQNMVQQEIELEERYCQLKPALTR